MNSMVALRRFSCVLLMAFITASGCSRGEKPPRFLPVEGTVKVDGVAVEGLVVSFFPDTAKGTKGPMSSAVCDEDGNFALTGPKNVVGAVEGSHKVTFACPMTGSTADGSRPPKTAPCTLPEKLSNPLTTDKIAEVNEETDHFEFELTSK